MRRTTGTNRVADKFGAGKDGHRDRVMDGLVIVEHGTAWEADMADSVQEELCNIVEGFGGTLDEDVKTQAFDALYGVIRGSNTLPSPFTRTHRIPPTGLGGSAWFITPNTGEAIASVDASPLAIDLGPYLPDGATLTDVQVRILPGAARSAPNRMSVQVYPYTGDGVQGAAIKAAADDSGSNVYQNIGATGLSVTINKATTRYIAQITSGTSGGSPNDRVAYVEITYVDNYPGRR